MAMRTAKKVWLLASPGPRSSVFRALFGSGDQAVIFKLHDCQLGSEITLFASSAMDFGFFGQISNRLTSFTSTIFICQ